MTVFVERFDREACFRRIPDHGAGREQDDKTKNVSRHGYPDSPLDSLDIEGLLSENRNPPMRRRPSLLDRRSGASVIGRALFQKRPGDPPYEQNIDERRPRVDVDQSLIPLSGNNGRWRSLPVGGTTPKIYLQLK
jgi:hypothetical protein